MVGMQKSWHMFCTTLRFLGKGRIGLACLALASFLMVRSALWPSDAEVSDEELRGNFTLQWLRGEAEVPEEALLLKLEQWYQEYGEGLERARAAARSWLRAGKEKMSDDIEMSISYLRLRATRPGVVWECSPAWGYSSVYILSALRDNNHGKLFSFGIEDKSHLDGAIQECCAPLMERWLYLEGDVWEFLKTCSFVPNSTCAGTGGDAQTRVPLPDYIYLDAAHSAEFGRLWAEKLLRQIRHVVPVSMHDAFRDGWSYSSESERAELRKHPRRPMPEPSAMLKALAKPPHREVCHGFTVSSSFSPQFFAQVKALHDKYVLSPRIEESDLNPTLYFELGKTSCAY
mmetsp:Transcript_113006/g.319695  ORF Transcript_113006/g.319695 Transcript_113006/m.319695 type:complete len:344 (-) Transcript_113006:240-1271(-)